MKIELKEIIDQLSDAANLPQGEKVSALIDDNKLVGWTIVHVYKDGTIEPISQKRYNTIKELFSFLNKN